jgi:cell division protease FtsH
MKMFRAIGAFIFWLLIGVSALLLWQVVRSGGSNQREPEISYSQFMADVEAGKVKSVAITGTQIRGQYRTGGGIFRLTGPSDPRVFLTTLQEKGVQVSFRDAANTSVPLQLIGSWAPLILLGALWFFMIRQMQKRGQGPPAPPPNAPINPV